MEPPNSVRMDRFKRIQGAFLMIGPKNYPIFKGVNTVGRNKIATVNIKHLNVSQNQAIIVLLDENQHYLSDLNSSNGTFLHNSKLIPYKLYELMNGVEIKFGDVSAVYSKITKNTRLNLQQTLDTTEMTQDMTQNFYASNTQVMFNKTDVNDHSYFNTETNNSSLCNIHEEATQVLDNPLHLPNTEIVNSDTQSQFQSCVVVEERVDDIHEAATQVVCMRERLQTDSPTNEINEKQPSQTSEISFYNKDIHEAPTQVVGCFENEDKEKLTSPPASPTQTLSTQDLIQAINVTINSADSNTQELTSQEKEDLIDRVDKKNKGDDEAEAVEVESNEDISKSSSLDKNPILTAFQKKNDVHNSQTPSTSKTFPQSEYDESFLNVSKTIKGVIEETIIENPDSNDSIDFLNIPNTSQDDVLSKNLQNVHIRSESQEIGFRKTSTKPIQSDSETDIDDTETIGFRKKTVKQLSTQDSDTDIESQHIGAKKRTVKPLPDDSDSDTDIDDNVESRKLDERPKISNSDSETDCEDEILQKLNDSKVTKDDICNKTEMNDSDCIPATQDAFADALGYEPTRTEPTNQSSEESFKLGLTELMDYSEPVTETNNGNDKIEEPHKTDTNIDETGGDEMYLMPTQKIADNSGGSKKFTFKKKSCTLDESLTSILSNNRNGSLEDDVFLQPTQKMVAEPSEQPDDDIFLQPTQILESDTAEKPRTDDDVFLQPGKPIKKKAIKNNTELDTIDEDSDNVFFEPTQKLPLEEPNTQDGDVYMAATQVLQEDADKKIEDIPMTQDDLYGQATRKLNILTQNQDVYDVATQQIDDLSNDQAGKIPNALNTDPNLPDTQLEMPFSSQTTHFNITEDSNRPSNPIVRELDHQDRNEEGGSSDKDNPTKTMFKQPLTIRDSTKSKDDPETLSQIEAFIKKPPPPTTATRRSVRKTNLDKEDEAPETLSQIEAFVQKPASIKLSEDAAPVETFISKPLPKVQAEVEIAISSRRPSKRISSNSTIVGDGVINNLSAVRYGEELEQSSKSSDDTLNDSERSRELKSDIDQSFALLESKSSKARRKPKLDPVIDEIKVSITSHRRSMSLAENLQPNIVVPVKKYTRTRKASTISEPEKRASVRGKKIEENKDSDTSDDKSTRKTRKASTSKEPEKRASVRGRKIEEMNDSDTSDDKSTRKTRKASTSGEPEPVPRKSRKLSTSNELKTVSARGKKSEEALETIIESAERGGRKSEDVAQKQPVGSKEVEDFSKTDKPIVKRRISDSSEADFVPSGPPTPAKRGRMGAKVNNVPSTDTSGKSMDSSASSDGAATPRKGRNAVKSESLLASAERSKRKQRPKVVFTMLDSPQLESFIKHLGGSIVDAVDSCTVLVTQSIKRSQKLLTAVAQGKPICSPEWIKSSKQNNEFLDPWDYLLVDKEAETKWEFSLRESLIRAGDKKLFEGLIFQLMVTNALDVLKGAIEASGGRIVTRQPGKSDLKSFIIIATTDQKSKFQRIKKQHPDVRVAEPEAIFDGVLRQEFRLSRHLLA